MLPLRALFMGGPWWGAFGLPGAYVTGLPILPLCPPASFGSVAPGEKLTKRRTMLQTNIARTGHVSPAILEFIARDAIRRAALAPTPADALDIAGDALLAVARIVQREVSHV